MKEFKGVLFVTFLFIAHVNILLLHAAPPIEACPHDSVQSGDTCKCDIEHCSKPPCLYELKLFSNGTDSPGSCCPTYSCVGCPNDTLINDQCPCAPGAVLDSNNECTCEDPHKTLKMNECICDPDRCELPQVCDVNSVLVSDKDGCCLKTKCIKCPSDSYSTNNDNGEIEDKCVCYPCTKQCGSNETVIIMQKGTGFPGSCCDLYDCHNNSVKNCIVDDSAYGEGEIWETSDLQTCKCQEGITFCSSDSKEIFRPCLEGGLYQHNQSWMSDSCTNCTCFDGKVKCISHMCEISEGRLPKPDCQPLNCSKVCPDGFKLNKRGCKICKCNYSYKYDDILQKYNITKSELKDIVANFFSQNRTEPTSTMPTTQSTSTSATTTIASIMPTANHKSNTSLKDSDVWHLIVWPVLTVVVCITALIIWLARKYKTKGSYDTTPGRTTYERVKLKKHTFFNNNYIGNNNKNKNSKDGV